MQRVLGALALSACTAHEIYERPDLDSLAATADWTSCQRAALAATGAPPPRDVGEASVRGNRLVGALTPDPEEHDVAGYKGEDWARISRRRQARQDCMAYKGYRFVGVPATERL